MIRNAAITYTLFIILAVAHNAHCALPTADSLEQRAQAGMRNTHGVKRFGYATLDTLICLKHAAPAFFTVAQTILAAYAHAIQTHTRKTPARELLELPLYSINSAAYESSSDSLDLSPANRRLMTLLV